MKNLSIAKTRWLFFVFFLALAVPSIILTYKAHEQLRWQALHEYQQDIREFVQQVNRDLLNALAKEEARSDTEYTFFVLAGSPEARFVQRSELSKYPVESNINGVIGYFQINQKGEFSSPILPSADVQSEVVPQLYGISVVENKQRSKLEQEIRQILSQNQFAIDHPSSETDSSIELDVNIEPSSNSNLASASSENQLKPVNDQAYQPMNERMEQTYLQRRKPSASLSRTEQQDKMKREQLEINTIKKNKEKQKRSKRAYYPNSKNSLIEQKQVAKKRVSRIEKSYSPQQSLIEESSSDVLISQKKIQISLFESEIEPFQFKRLQSGHFVLFRKVQRKNKRVIQGVLIDQQKFIQQVLQQRFIQSSLYQISSLSVYFSDQLLKNIVIVSDSKSNQSLSSLRGELLAEVPLSEPFSQLGLVFRVTQLPTAAGAPFITAIAASLLFILVVGTYFLYRLTIKQYYFLAQQQNFVSSVSHELKTPLTSIRMYGEILKQGWLSDEKREQYYDFIYTEAERLSRLIANVLQISKVNQNALELNLQAVEISELLSLIKSKVDSQITHSDFTLQIFMDRRLNGMSLLVDSDGFVQIIINLVDNAIKYAGNAEKKQIDISFELLKSEKINIMVRDYGPGIEKASIKHVFELFYRSGNELTRETTGTGIGLSLVKEFCIAMSAEISVKNKNPGVEFSILFSSVN